MTGIIRILQLFLISPRAPAYSPVARPTSSGKLWRQTANEACAELRAATSAADAVVHLFDSLSARLAFDLRYGLHCRGSKV